MKTISVLVALMLLAVTQSAVAQELQPRRWTHLPVGANFFGIGSAYSDKKISVDPAIELEGVEAEVYTTVMRYVRVLDLFGKSGRVDVIVPYSSARWEGELEGQPASTRRRGFGDPSVRLAINLLGSPAQRGEEFRRFKVSTIVGASMELTVPVGDYNRDRLINLGSNRWVVKSQLGVTRTWSNWSAEVTGSAWFYGDNDKFARDSTLERDSLYGVQGHLIYEFKPGLWTSLSAAYGAGGQTKIDGVKSGDRVGKRLLAASFGLPLNSKQGMVLTYLRGDTDKDTGSDDNTYLLAYSIMWGGD